MNRASPKTEASARKTVWFVTRHSGAIEWAKTAGIAWDRLVGHLDPKDVRPGDIVLGTLPMHEAALICSKGAQFWALTLCSGLQDRGRELLPGELAQRGVTLRRFTVIENSADTLPQSV